MPSTVVEVRCEYSESEEIALLDAVQAALVEGFKIPAHDKNVRLIVHAPHRFLCSSDLPMPERFTVITLDAFSGRSVEAKRNLYRVMVNRLESSRESWGIKGGKAACDVEMDFKIDV